MRFPRAVAAILLGTLAGMLCATALGAVLARQARSVQAVRSQRVHDLGTPAVPSPALLSGLGWRDDLAAGVFYGLSAGWPLGGALALLALGLSLPRRRVLWIPALALAAGLAVCAAADELAPLLWCLGLGAAGTAARLSPAPFRALCSLSGLLLAALLFDPLAGLPLAAFGLLVPWAAAGAARLAWRPAP